jgi:acyl carrier protein
VLTLNPLAHSSYDASSVEARVLDIIAEMSGLERVAILAASRLLDSPLDSLTSIAVVTRIEVAFGIVADDEVFALLAARDFGGLGRLVGRIVAEQRTKLGETAGNESC